MVILIAGGTHTGKTLLAQRKYIENHSCDILRFEKIIERRLPTSLAAEEMIKNNEYNLEQCVFRNYNHILKYDNCQINIDKI